MLVAAVAAFAAFAGSGADQDNTLTHTVERTNLRITVTERGNLESQKTVDGVCELRGYSNKIIFIVPEGEVVKKGDVVVRFDSAEIDKEITEQEIETAQAKSLVETTDQEVEVKINEGKSAIAAAELELTLAKLDLEKYRDGDYKVELNDLQGKIALAEVELERSRDAFESFKVLVKKGFREPEQLRTEQQQVAYAQFNLERDKETLEVLKKYDYKRKLTEFQAKAEEAERKLARAIATDKATVAKAKAEAESAKGVLKMEEQDLEEWLKQKEKCEIIAKQTGVLAYANEDWYDSDRRIREGAVVYRRQKIFSLPDMSLMQVKVNVHESVVKKVKAGQRAKVRVDAFPNDTLFGVVKNVSQLADSSNSWRRGGVKEYTTIVTLDDASQVDIKPGMTAEVEILVDNLRDVIAVPVQAVTEHKHQHFVYVKTGNDFVRTPVEIGQSNNRMVEVTSGIEEEAEVSLDARARGIAEFADDTLELGDDDVGDDDVSDNDVSDNDVEDSQTTGDDNQDSADANDSNKASKPADENIASTELADDNANVNDANENDAKEGSAKTDETGDNEAKEAEKGDSTDNNPKAETDQGTSSDESAFPTADSQTISTDVSAVPATE